MSLLVNQCQDSARNDGHSGPTVYIPMAFRHRVEHIYTSDYADANRASLLRWSRREPGFDWTAVCKWMAGIEATIETPHMMQENTRKHLRAVLSVDVHKQAVISAATMLGDDQSAEDTVPKQFDVVATVFCLEYASESAEEYRRAVRNATGLINPGGYLIQGGVMNAKEYAFAGRRFRCHHLTERELFACLAENGMETRNGPDFKFITYEDVFLLASRKKTVAEEE